jgi:pimeloyl-ACP methyl ester carboxylesterase
MTDDGPPWPPIDGAAGDTTAAGPPLPAGDDLDLCVEDACRIAFGGYVGRGYDDSDLDFSAVPPPQAAWRPAIARCSASSTPAHPPMAAAPPATLAPSLARVTTEVEEFDVALHDGRTLRGYDTGSNADDQLTVVWHHGTPNVGTPPTPLFAAAARHRIRWLAYDRPGYGGSTPHPGRTVGDAAADTAAVADARGADRIALLGHSGGGSHALACAARLPAGRVRAVASIAGLAPPGAAGLDWFAGMSTSGEAGLRAAAAGRRTKECYEEATTEGDPGFTPGDWAALAGPWSWFGPVVTAALAHGRGPLIDDDLAYVTPWGCDPADIPPQVPVLLVHGGADRLVPAAHGEWLARRVPHAELWLRPHDGHIEALAGAGEQVLAWLADPAAGNQARPGSRDT